MDIRFEEYLKALKEQLLQSLGGDYSCMTVRDETVGLLISRDGKLLTGRIDVDGYYTCNVCVEAAAGDIIRQLYKPVREKVCYEDVKDKIGIRLRGRHEPDALEVSFLDLKIVFYVQSDTGNEERIIDRKLFHAWNVDMHDFYQQAMANERRDRVHKIVRMDSRLQGMMQVNNTSDQSDVQEIECGGMQDLWLLVTNRQYYMGASVILRPEVIGRLAELYGGDFLILLGSVHEVMTVPYDAGCHGNGRELKMTVKGFYANSAAVDEGLSANVYRYDSQSGSIKRFL